MRGHRRAILVPGGLLALLAILTVYMTVSHTVISHRANQLVDHTHRVIEANQRVVVSMQDAERGVRSFILTGDTSYRRALDTATQNLTDALTELDALVADNPDQAPRAAALRAAVAARAASLETAFELAVAGQREPAIAAIEAGRSGDQIGPVRSIALSIGAEERRLLDLRGEAAGREEERGYLIAALLSLVVLLGLAAALISMVRSNRTLIEEVQRRMAAEASERAAAELIQTVFRHTPEYLVLIEVGDEGFVIADVNPAFEHATGFEAEKLRGRDVRKAFGALGATAHEQYGRVIAENRVLTIAEPVSGLSERTLIWETVLAPVRDADGRIVRIVSSSRDVTEREAMETQLRQAQRMEAVGQLTGGVAHDFNNLLQVIGANLEMIGPAIGDQPRALKQLRSAMHGAERAAQLTRQMLAFARRQPLEPRVVNLGRLVGDMAEMMRRTIGEAVEIETVIAGGLWNTIADPAQVESAVLNLAINARDAMPGGGRLTIELSNATLDDAYARRAPDIAPGQYVLLAVSDTGQGMDPEVAARVFEPFFTTKPEGKGTGLGLSMVYGFVKQSNGHVQIYSEPGSGTTVKIYLPRSRKPEETAAGPADLPTVESGCTILVVEDDAAVRAAAVSMLEDLGYRCLEAADAEAGLEVVRSGATIDLLFTDVIMPGPLKTPDFVAQVQALRPGLPVLYTSGYTENAIVHHGRLDEGVHLLSKPYNRSDLARKISQGLSAARPTVLVVEDDALVRVTAADMLSELGLAVIAVGDAPAALAHLQGAGRVDLLFTDVGLPGMRGPALAAEARALRPGIQIVFASGYGETEETAAIADALYMAKPYQRRELKKVVMGLIETGAS